MKVKLSKSAKKDIEKLNKEIRKKVYQEIRLLRQGKTRIIRLKGRFDTGKARVDNYRILFNIEKNIITVTAVVMRKDATGIFKEGEASKRAGGYCTVFISNAAL